MFYNNIVFCVHVLYVVFVLNTKCYKNSYTQRWETSVLPNEPLQFYLKCNSKLQFISPTTIFFVKLLKIFLHTSSISIPLIQF